MTEALYMIRRDPARNMARFYRVEIASDLFGGAVVIRSWGRIGRAGTQLRIWCADRDAARNEMTSVITRKLRRGYEPG